MTTKTSVSPSGHLENEMATNKHRPSRRADCCAIAKNRPLRPARAGGFLAQSIFETASDGAAPKRQGVSAQDLQRIEQTLKDQDLEFTRLTEVLRDNPDGLFGVETSLFEELTTDAKATHPAVPAAPNAVRC